MPETSEAAPETEAAVNEDSTTEAAKPKLVAPNESLGPNPLRPPRPRPKPSPKDRTSEPKQEEGENDIASDANTEADKAEKDHDGATVTTTDDVRAESADDEVTDDTSKQADLPTPRTDETKTDTPEDTSEMPSAEKTKGDEKTVSEQTDDKPDTKGRQPRKKARQANPERKAPARPQGPRGGLPLVPTVIVTFLLAVVLTLAAVFLAKGLLDSRESRQDQTIETPAENRPETPEPSQTETMPEAKAQVADATQVATKCLPSVVSIRTAGSKGNSIASGVIIDDKGHVITNWHVIEDADRIGIDAGDEQIEAKLIGGDKSSDVAVIQADLSSLEDAKPIEVGDSSELKVGDWVMTLGSPLGLEKSASAGIVSALSRNTVMSGSGENTVYVNLIQVDAAINSGNSGGALVNDKGQLVGINTLYANGAGDEAFAGIGFAIPGNFADDIAQKVIAGETITHAYIGLSCSTINSQSAKAAGVSATHGAYVAEIVPDAPGAQAGIAIGDVITKIGDTPISSADDYILAIRSHEPSEVVDIVIDRQGNKVTAQVTLGSDDQAQRLQDETK